MQAVAVSLLLFACARSAPPKNSTLSSPEVRPTSRPPRGPTGFQANNVTPQLDQESDIIVLGVIQPLSKPPQIGGFTSGPSAPSTFMAGRVFTGALEDEVYPEEWMIEAGGLEQFLGAPGFLFRYDGFLEETPCETGESPLDGEHLVAFQPMTYSAPPDDAPELAAMRRVVARTFNVYQAAGDAWVLAGFMQRSRAGELIREDWLFLDNYVRVSEGAPYAYVIDTEVDPMHQGPVPTHDEWYASHTTGPGAATSYAKAMFAYGSFPEGCP